MQIWKLKIINDVITKKAKLGLLRNQVNFKSIEKYQRELSKNKIFIEFEPLCQKLWAFYQISAFFNARWPNMVMSRDPKCKFLIILFFVILHLTLFDLTWAFFKLSVMEGATKSPTS